MKKLLIAFIILLFLSCARWKDPPELPKKTVLTITISCVGNADSYNGSYFILFDNDNDISDGPYINLETNELINATYYVGLKDNIFRIGQISSAGEPLSTASVGENKIIVQIATSYFGNVERLQINVATFDKNGNIIDTLDKNGEVRDAYISYDIVSGSLLAGADGKDKEGDTTEENKHLDIKEVKIEKSVI